MKLAAELAKGVGAPTSAAPAQSLSPAAAAKVRCTKSRLPVRQSASLPSAMSALHARLANAVHQTPAHLVCAVACCPALPSRFLCTPAVPSHRWGPSAASSASVLRLPMPSLAPLTARMLWRRWPCLLRQAARMLLTSWLAPVPPLCQQACACRHVCRSACLAADAPRPTSRLACSRPGCLQAEALKSKLRGEAAPEAAPSSEKGIFQFGRGAEVGALAAAGTAIAAALAVRSG